MKMKGKWGTVGKAVALTAAVVAASTNPIFRFRTLRESAQQERGRFFTRGSQNSNKGFVLTNKMKADFERALVRGFKINPTNKTNIANSLIDKAMVRIIYEQSQKHGVSPQRVFEGIYACRKALREGNNPEIRALIYARDVAIKEGDKGKAEELNCGIGAIINIDALEMRGLKSRLNELFVESDYSEGKYGLDVFNAELRKKP